MPGYWVRGEFNLNLPGHELFEDYTDKSVTVSVCQDNGESSLSPGQGIDKYKVLAVTYVSNSKKVDDNLSTLTPDAMLAMLRG